MKKQSAQTVRGTDQTLHLHYTLAELPSSQHRAGLAGLVLMARWLERQPIKDRGVCAIESIDGRGASFEVDRAGMRTLVNALYDAAMTEVKEPKQRKDKNKNLVEPLRIEEVEVIDKKTKASKLDKDGSPLMEKRYVYPKVVPKGAFLEELDPSAEKVWAKLWRDMVWTILRGVPATRRPFEMRASGETDNTWEKTFAGLNKHAEDATELPSTYFLGAQACNAENVPFQDRWRFRFLLEFWPLVCPIYVPRFLDKEGKASLKPSTFVFAVPDVANLEAFCEDYPAVVRDRQPEVFGYRPRQAIIDTLAEGGLDTLVAWGKQIAKHSSTQDTSDLILGVDVIATAREGNNVRVSGTQRVEPNRGVLDCFERIRGLYWDPGFREQRLKNLTNAAPWHQGFSRYLSTCPRHKGVDSATFKHDAREAFKPNNEVVVMDQEKQETSLEALVYQIVGTYLSRKLESKHNVTWHEGKDNEKMRADFDGKKEKLAKGVFLAIRSRTGGDFIEYFSSTLFAVKQFLKEDDYLSLSRSLLDDTETVRTLTLLALSARG